MPEQTKLTVEDRLRYLGPLNEDVLQECLGHIEKARQNGHTADDQAVNYVRSHYPWNFNGRPLKKPEAAAEEKAEDKKADEKKTTPPAGNQPPKGNQQPKGGQQQPKGNKPAPAAPPAPAAKDDKAAEATSGAAITAESATVDAVTPAEGEAAKA